MRLNKLIMSASVMLFMSCGEEIEQDNIEESTVVSAIETEESINKVNPLKNKLDAKKAKFEATASEDKKEKYAAGIQFVIDNKIVESAMQIGDQAPDFSLTNALGKTVNLYSELEKGPVILMWYRGGWCPYCNMTLHAMQENLPLFKELGANLLALTPELPDSSISTSEKNDLDFQVLSDLNNQVARQYKVVFTLTDDVGDLYENGFGLSQYNGNNDNELPLAATYIVGTDKIIKYAFLDPDYRNRAEPSDIINVLEKM
ncbi:MAG: peroxiredoxin family protein [Crocinitomicaceae bacterium]